MSVKRRGHISLFSVVVTGVCLWVSMLVSATPSSAAGPASASAILSAPATDGALAAESAAYQEALAQERPRTPIDVRALPQVDVVYGPSGVPTLRSLPRFDYQQGGRFMARDRQGNRITFGVDPVLQARAESLLRAFRVPYGALVAVEPKTGRILAIASYSAREDDSARPLSTRATFPAASLFKCVTSAAAIETAGLSGNNLVAFRGGNYDLGPSNYLPDISKDRRVMSLSEALGKSINPVFARVALNNLSAQTLARYARSFGFNGPVPFDAPIETSTFAVSYDKYDIARTAAGFGNVFISPVHAALLAAAVGNDGQMPRPYLVERVEDSKGTLRYEPRRTPFLNSILPSTALELKDMMRSTVETGTARKHFWSLRNLWSSSFPIAAKTGTLSGDSPKGLYQWFIATAPIKNSEIAIASLVIDPGGARIKGSGLGSKFLQYYYALKRDGLSAAERLEVVQPPTVRAPRRRHAALRAHPNTRRHATSSKRRTARSTQAARSGTRTNQKKFVVKPYSPPKSAPAKKKSKQHS